MRINLTKEGYNLCRAISSVIRWLALWAGKMNQFLCFDWLLEQARWCSLAHSGLSAVSHRKIVFFFNIINPLLTKLVWSRWLDIGHVLFCVFMDRDRVKVTSTGKKKELCQHPAILTSCLVNNPCVLNN